MTTTTLADLKAALQAGRDLIEEAMSTHIYDERNGEKPDADCGYAAHVALVDRLLGNETDEERHAKAKETWDGPTDSDGEPCFYINEYHCDDCDEDWTDQWSCGCDDECPKCGQDISPTDSIDVTEQSTDAEQVAAFEQALVSHDATIKAQRAADFCPTCGAEHTE